MSQRIPRFHLESLEPRIMLSAAAGVEVLHAGTEQSYGSTGAADEQASLLTEEGSEQAEQQQEPANPSAFSEEETGLFSGMEATDLEASETESDFRKDRSEGESSEALEGESSPALTPAQPEVRPGALEPSTEEESEDLTQQEVVFSGEEWLVGSSESAGLSVDGLTDTGRVEVNRGEFHTTAIINSLHGPQGPPRTGSNTLEAGFGETPSEAGNGIEAFPKLPGLELEEKPRTANAVFFLNFGGVEEMDYDGPVEVKGLSLPAFSIPETSTLSRDRIIDRITQRVESIFGNTGLTFTTSEPGSGESYSTLFIGGTDSAFSEYGSFDGLAEGVDRGNRIPDDDALVFSATILESVSTTEQFIDRVAGTVARETGRLIGYANVVSGAESDNPLYAVANQNNLTDITLTETQRDNLYNGLQAFRSVLESVETDTSLGDFLEAVGETVSDFSETDGFSLAEASQLATSFLNGVVLELENLLNPTDGSFPTTAEVVTALENAGQTVGDLVISVDPATVFGGRDGSNNEVIFGLKLEASQSLPDLPLDLGDLAKESGLFATEDLTANATGSLILDFEFGLDLTSGGSPTDAFFVRTNQIQAGISGSASNLDFGINVGFLEASITGGSAQFTQVMDLALTNPDGDAANRITRAEFESATLQDLVNLSVDTANFSATLPVSATLDGLAPVGNPRVELSSDNLLETAPTVSFLDFDGFKDFTSLDASSIVNLLSNAVDLLTRFESSTFLDTSIPFTDSQIGDVVRMGEILNEQVLSQLQDEDGVLKYQSIQELVPLLENLLGLNAGALNWEYLSAAQELVLPLNLTKTFDALEVDLGLDEDFGPLEVYTSSSNVTLTVDTSLNLELRIDLTRPEALVTGASALPADGVLSSDATFEVGVQGNDPIPLLVSPDSSNASETNPREALVEDINQAIAATALAGRVQASLNADNKLVFTTQTFGPAPSVLLVGPAADGGDGNAADDDLGLVDSLFDDDPISERVTLSRADLNASLALDTTTGSGESGVTAGATLGFVGVSVGNGQLDFDVGVQADLVNGESLVVADVISDFIEGDPTNTLNPDIQYTCNGFLELSEIEVGSDLLAGPAANASIRIDVDCGVFFGGSGGNPFAVSFNGDFGDVFDFENLGFTDILNAIVSLGDTLKDSASESFLNTTIPFLDVSIDELFNFAKPVLDLIEKIGDSNTRSLQDLDLFIREFLITQYDTFRPDFEANGLTLPQIPEQLVSKVGDVILFDIPLVAGIIEGLNFALDAGNAIPGLEQLLDLRGQTDLKVGLTSQINLNFGLDVSDPANPQFHLYDGSGIEGGMFLDASGIEFDGAVGPIGVFVRDGTLSIGDAASPAGINFTLNLPDPDPNDNLPGRTSIDSLGIGDFTFDLTGSLDATIPLRFPTAVASNEIGSLSLNAGLTNLGSATVEFTSPTGKSLEDIIGDADFGETFASGVDLFFVALEELADGDIFGIELPFIGDALGDVSTFLLDIRNNLDTAFSNATEFAEAALETALFDVLGPAGADILLPQTGTGTPEATDVDVTLVLNNADLPEEVIIDVRLGQLENLTPDLAFDLGLPGLGLELEEDGGNSSLNIEFGWEFDLEFGVSATDGFFVDTSVQDELTIDVLVTLPDTDLVGTLGVIQARARDKFPNDPNQRSQLDLGFAVDLKDPAGTDTRLTLTEMSQDFDNAFTAELSGGARLNLELEVGFASLSGDPVDALPSFLVDFVLNWDLGFQFDGLSDTSKIGSAPTVEFKNIRLDVGSFFDDFLRPIAETVDNYVGPIRPLVEFLTTRVKPLEIGPLKNIFEDPNDNDDIVTFLDVAVLTGRVSSGTSSFIQSVDLILDIVDTIANGNVPGKGDNLEIPLGDFAFGSTDLRDGSLGAIDPSTDGTFSDDGKTLEQKFNDVVGGKGAEIFSATQESAPDGSGKFEFLLFQPENLVNLLMGNPVDFFQYNLPQFGFDFSVTKSIPIFSPPQVNLNLGMGFSAEINLAFGYDSSGIERFLQPDGKPSDIFGGFYVVTGDAAPPLLELEGFLSGGVGVGVPGASINADIRLIAEADFSLIDPGDGKLYFSTIADLVEREGAGVFKCLFIIEGGLSGEFKISLKVVGVEVFSVGPEFDLVSFKVDPEDCFLHQLPDRLERVEGGRFNNDSRGLAAELGSGPGIHLRGASLSSNGDIDWYQFNTLKQEDLRVELQGESHLELEVQDEDGNILDFSNSGSEKKVLNLAGLPEGDYFVKVTSQDEELSEYDLNIDPAATSSTRVFYVNDPAVTDPTVNSYYALAPGDDSNNGLSPESPKATLGSLLADQDLEPGDLVLVDSGIYGGNATIGAADSGFTLAGAPRTLYKQLFESGDIPSDWSRTPDALTGADFNGSGTQLTTQAATDLLLTRVGFESAGSNTGLSIVQGSNIALRDAEFNNLGTGLKVDGTSNFSARELVIHSTALGIEAGNTDQLILNNVTVTGTAGNEQGARIFNSSNPAISGWTGEELAGILTLDTVTDFQVNQISGGKVDRGILIQGSEGTTNPAQLSGLDLAVMDEGLVVENSNDLRIQGLDLDGDGTELDEQGEPLFSRGQEAIRVTDSDAVEILSPQIRDFVNGIHFQSGVNGVLEQASLINLDNGLLLNGTDGFAVTDGVWDLNKKGAVLTDAVNTLIDGTTMDFSGGGGGDAPAIEAGVAALTRAGNNRFQNLEVTLGSLELKSQEGALVDNNTLDRGGILLDNNLNTEILGNAITHPDTGGSGGRGIVVSASEGVEVRNNSVDGADTALKVENGTLNLLARNNTLKNGSVGIHLVDGTVQGTTLIDNTVDEFNDTGILAAVEATITDNEVRNSGTGVVYDGSTVGLRGNQIHSNNTGLTGTGILGADAPQDDQVNNIFNNTTGVVAPTGVDVQFNRIYGNGTGITTQDNVHVHHNRIFRNTGKAILVSGDSGVLIDNNTIYSPHDTSIRIEGGSSNTTLRNNIIWNTEGYGIYVANNSQPGFDSDYNNLYMTGNGQIVWYQKPFEDLLNWQIEARQDLNSLGSTELDPNLDQPAFVDPGNDDYRIQIGATTLNSGDPAYDFSAEPGPNGGPNGLRINLGAFGGTSQAAQSPESYLRILSPEYYVDYNVDVARRIVWESFNVSGNVKLEVHEAGVGKVADITTVTVDNLPAEISSQEPRIGSYFWSPQQDGLSTDLNRRYFLRLISADDAAVQDDNREPFSVPPQNNEFYLNDDSTTGDTFTSATGNNRNTGKSAGDPKAILPAFQQNYQLGANQTVFVDAGYYMHVVNLVISADGTTGNDEAFTLEGSGGGVVFDRANERAGTRSLEILDADFLTFRNLTLEGGQEGLKIHSQSIFFKGENLNLSNHPEFGLSITGGSNNSTLLGLTVSGNGDHGILIDGTVLEISDSTITNNAAYGMDLANTGDGVITGNLIQGNNRGIDIFNNAGTLTTIGNSDTSLGLGNIVSGNASYGIRASGKVLVAGNTVSNQTSPSSFGIYSNGVDVLNNLAFGNGRGIFIDDPNLVEGNRTYNNREYGLAVSSSATVRNNVSYSNETGLLIFRNSNQVENNLFYDNSREGIRLDGTFNNTLLNNTIYQPLGDGLRLINSENTDLRNNIVVVQEGVALRLDTNSQSDFSSNFNLLRAENNGRVGFWQGSGRSSLTDWQNATRQDRQSLDRDPQFVNPAGADGQLGFFDNNQDGSDDDFHVQSQFGSFHGGSLAPILDEGSGLPVFPSTTLTVDANQSPAIDLGDDTSSFANEPADNGNFINLGTYGNTVQASKSPPEYVLVTNPDGGETWPQEQEFTIRWRSHDFTGDVDILLQRDSETNPVSTIADNTANDGTFTWILPNTLPEGADFRIEVIRQDDPSITGESFEPFAISPPISFYYVNDSSVIVDGYATAVGDDANDGLSPSTPKATIQAVLESYTLGEGDVILVDPGTYGLTTNIDITSADAGVIIRGFVDPARPDEVSLLDRGNTSSDAYVFELDNADGLVLEQLSITGGYYGVFADRDLDSDDLTLQNNTIYGNERDGIRLERGNDRARILDNTFFGDLNGGDTQDNGVYVNDIQELELSGNTAHGHRSRGMYAVNLDGALVEGNTTFNNNSDGLFVAVRDGFTGTVQGNESYGNGNIGIRARGDSVVLSENTTYGQTGSNDYGLFVEDDATARNNVSHSNYYGIGLDDGGTAENNRVYNNSQAGIRANDFQREFILGNQIYSNKIGIDSRSNNDLIENNQIYDNSLIGIRLDNGDNAIVRNNTIYQATNGIGISLIDDSRQVTLRNNIVRVDDGFALSVSSNSQEGFSSDYNLYQLGNSANLLQWGGEVFNSRLDVFFFLDLEANSFLTDPRFIDMDGEDGILGYDANTSTDGGLDDNFRLNPSSSAIDAGDPESYFLEEPQPHGGRANIGAFGNTIEATNSPAEVVQMLTPNGFEKYQVGEQVDVEFRTWGLLDEQILGLINVGGASAEGWLADNYNTSGDSTTTNNNAVDLSAVSDPAPESVYQSYRYDFNDPLVYELPLPDGDYTVKLHFNPIAFSEGRDVLDIIINGTTVEADFDARKEAGERYKAVARSFAVNVSGGEVLEIRLNPKNGNARLSAIELRQANPGGVTAPTADLDFSDDGGVTFQSLAADVAVNRLGTGSFTWTPATETGGNDGFLRATADTGTNAQGQSREAFLVANAGSNYYLNDNDTTGDVFTTAAGDNLNSGKAPDDPMASLFALLKAYDLNAGDTVHIDTGNYLLRRNITITEADAGLTLLGPSTETALLDRANFTSGTAVLELINADDVTVENLHLTGAETGILADRNNDSDGVTLRNNEIFGNDDDGVRIDTSNDNWTLEDNRFYGLPDGSSFDQDDGVDGSGHSGTQVLNNLFFNHRNDGLRLSSMRDIHVQGNESRDNGSDGFDISLNGGDVSEIRDNLAHGNNSGFRIFGEEALVVDNVAHSHNQGSFDIGFTLDRVTARHNVSYNNWRGVSLDDGGLFEQNRVYNNQQEGIQASDFREHTIRDNDIYGNKIGVSLGSGNDVVENNRIYDNSQTGILLNNADSTTIRNNTLFQAAGRGIKVTGNAWDVEVRNNIIRMDAGAAIEVFKNSQRRFDSDYNLLDLGTNADWLDWGGEIFNGRQRIFHELGIERHSQTGDPRFVDPDGPDDILGFDENTGTDGGLDDNFRLQSDSPAIDAGDPVSYFLAEPGPNGYRVNLGAYGNTSEAATGAASGAYFLNPAPFDKFEQGEVIPVEFLSFGYRETQVMARMNAGGPTEGFWSHESFQVGSSTTRSLSSFTTLDLSGIEDPAPEAVYRTYTQAPNGNGNRLGYTLPVENGSYQLRLHFVPTAFSTGSDVFDIEVNGNTLRTDYDPRAESGARYTAITETLEVTVSNGEGLDLSLINKSGRAEISALEVIQTGLSGSAQPTFEVSFSKDGGTTSRNILTQVPVDSAGRGSGFWTADTTTNGVSGMMKVGPTDNTAETFTLDDPFLIAPAGEDYYINDSSLTGDVYTTSVGDDANSGRSPDQPMANLFALLAAYDLGANDTVYVDTGSYNLYRNLQITGDNSGLTITGPDSASEEAILDRGNISNESYGFEFLNTQGVTLENLVITGGDFGIFADRDTPSTEATIRTNTFHGNDTHGVEMESGNDQWLFEGNLFHGEGGQQRNGLYAFAINGLTVRDNIFRNLESDGLRVTSAQNLLIENNTSFENKGEGIEAFTSGNASGMVRGNEVYANEHRGIRAGGTGIVLEENETYGHQNNNWSAGLDLSQGVARNNEVYENERGILLSNHATAEANRIYGNLGPGIITFDSDDETITGNIIYSNRIGIQLEDSDDIVTNNLVYANADQGILLDDADRAFVRNNTVFHPVGNALEVRDGTSDADIRNNIFWVNAGFNVRVTSSSTAGLQLDYNLYNLSTDPNARQGDWQGSFIDTLSDWQATTGLDAQSHFGDPAFFDIDGADDVFAYVDISGTFVDGGIDDNFHLLKNSPAIDRGYFNNTPPKDLEGDPRKDDPGTTNTGSGRYDPTVQATQLFDPNSGNGQFNRSDDGSYFYRLPFDFTFFGKIYDDLEISSNGYVQFDTFNTSLPDADNDPQALIDTADPTMAVLWDDLTTGATGNDIFIDESVAGQVTIRWEATYKPDDTPVNLALVLFDNGEFRFDYGTGNSNLSPTVGIADGNGRAIFAQYDGVSTLDSVSSVAFPTEPGFDDLGAYEFKGSSLDNTPPVVVGTDPLIIQQGGNLEPTLAEFEVLFSEAIDSIDARSIFSYQLILDSDENGLFEESDQFFTLLPQYENLSDRVTLLVESGGLPSGDYQLQVFSKNLRDVSGNPLDGNEDDSAGGNYRRTFSISDTVPPTVDITIQPEDRLSNGLNALDLVFNEALDATPVLGDLELRDLDSGTLIDPANLNLQWDAETRTASVTFPGFSEGLLPPANYELTVLAATVADAAGNALDGNADGTGGDNAVFTFTVETIQQPVADFSITPTEGDTGTTFTFDGTLSTDPDGTIASYAWDFGDGSTGTGGNPQHQFSDAGTYTISLTVTDNDGATHTTTAQLEVSNQAPQITFTVTPENGELDTLFEFDASGSVDNDGTIQSYVWDFGDGNSATGVQVSHQFSSIGVFTVTLTLSDNDGAIISADQTVGVGNQAPTADIGVTPTAGDTSTLFVFDGSGSTDPEGSLQAYAWDFGDGNTGTGSQVNHTFADDGTYTVTLTVTDAAGANDSATLTVTVGNQAPVAAFTVTPGSGSIATAFTLDATGSNDPDGTITGYEWDFGDGTTASGDTATHTYGSPGDYTLSLTVTDDDGSTTTVTEVVAVENQAPVADFTVTPGSGDTATSFEFDGGISSDLEGPIADYSWDFGDGTTATGALVNHTFLNDGIYTVTLTVTDALGASDTQTSQLVVDNRSPVAAIDASALNGDTATEFTFDGTLSTDPDGTISSYAWDFGDGTTATGSQVNHTFSDDSTYTVTLTITDDDGATDLSTATLVVANRGPVAAVQGLPLEGDTGTVFAFDGGDSTDTDGVIASYAWDFGDGNTAGGSQVNHRFVDDGTYTITLTVTDDDGATASSSIQVSAANRGPTADLGVSPQEGDLSTVFTFDGSGSTDADGFIADTTWDFGDGTTASGPQAGHAYTKAGIYTVVLTVTDDDGATAIASLEIEVVNRAPVADVQVDPVGGTVDTTFNFDGTASSDPDGTLAAYAWDFGDGNSAQGATTSHPYALPGIYTVTLTVTDDQGAVDTETLEVEVENRLPVADFTVTPDQGDTATTLTLDASPSSDPDQDLVSYAWDLGDGTTATGELITVGYEDDGTYAIILTVTDSTGATDTTTADVTISNRAPTAVADANPLNGDTATEFTFDAGDSSDPDGTIVEFSWDFGDGNTATGSSASHSYDDDGTYTVTLTVTDDDGATHSDTLTVEIANRAPEAIADASPREAEPGDPITFNAFDSMDPDGTITEYEWDFGDGATATGPEVEHAYATEGEFLVTLTVTDNDGAQSSVDVLVGIGLNDLPEPFLVITPASGDTGTPFNLDAGNSTDPDGSIVEYAWDFGDGNTARGEQVSHPYADDGVYVVTLTVTDDAGDSVSATQTVEVTNRGPEASIAIEPVDQDSLFEFTFDASGSTDSDGQVVDYAWDFGDGSSASGSRVTHTYGEAGDFVVALTVLDDDGARGIASNPVSISQRIVEIIPDFDRRGESAAPEWLQPGRAMQTLRTELNALLASVGGNLEVESVQLRPLRPAETEGAGGRPTGFFVEIDILNRGETEEHRRYLMLRVETGLGENPFIIIESAFW